MSFRIGRRFASHVYPTSPPGGPGLTAYASNYVDGPGTDQAIATSPGTPAFTNTNGSTVAAGALTAQGVPLTPHVTGVVVLSGVVNVHSTAGGAVTVSVFPEINGVTSPDPIAVALVSPGSASIPIFFVVPPALSVGATAHVNLVVVASGAGVSLTAASGSNAFSSIALREVPAATG